MIDSALIEHLSDLNEQFLT